MKPIKYILIFGFTLILIFPLYWMFIGSLQDAWGVMKIPPNWIPKNLSIRNYQYFFQEHEMGRFFFNTMVILAIKTVLTILAVTTAGYAFSIYKFRYKQIIFIAFIFGIFVPGGVLLIPTFVTVRNLGIGGTWWGFLLPGVYMPVCVYLFKNYVDTIPIELVESARLDNASEVTIITRIMLPLCKPAIGVVVILVAMNTLQDYIWGVLMLTEPRQMTLMVGIMNAIAQRCTAGSDIISPVSITLAGGVIVFLPLFIIFMFCQRYFTEGLMLGGMK